MSCRKGVCRRSKYLELGCAIDGGIGHPISGTHNLLQRELTLANSVYAFMPHGVLS